MEISKLDDNDTEWFLNREQELLKAIIGFKKFIVDIGVDNTVIGNKQLWLKVEKALESYKEYV